MNAPPVVRSRCLMLPYDDIDTDQIIPAKHLTTTSRAGLAAGLFSGWTDARHGRITAAERRTPRPSILVAGSNFGCGSSREHAAWALAQWGIRVVISQRVADIFRTNAAENGIIPVELDEANVASLLSASDPLVEVDLATTTLSVDGGARTPFSLDSHAKRALTGGDDPLTWLLTHRALIDAYERRRLEVE